MKKKNQEEIISDVMDNFDFEKVEFAMECLNWTWGGIGIPDISEIRESALARIKNSVDQVLNPENKEHPDIGWISYSGGLKATAWKTESGKLSAVRLEFILNEWESLRKE